MKSRRKKSKRASGLISFINGLGSLSLVVIAVILVIFVFFYIRNNSFFDPLPFSKAYRNQDQEKGIEVIESDISSASGYGDSVGLDPLGPVLPRHGSSQRNRLHILELSKGSQRIHIFPRDHGVSSYAEND